MTDERLELSEVEGHPGTRRYVFADEVALRMAMGKHSTEDPDAYRAQVNDLEEGAAHFVNFALVAIEKHLGNQ